MKILSLHVEGFRSLKSQTWKPGDLNVLIGPNAGGKTNLLRLFALLTDSAKGRLGDHVLREGGMESLVTNGHADAIRIRLNTTSFPPYERSETDALTYELTMDRVGRSSAHRVGHEVLGNFCKVEAGETKHPHFLLQRDPERADVYSIADQKFEAPPSSVPDAETLLSTVAGPFAVNRFASNFRAELSAWRIHEVLATHREARIRSPQVTRADAQVDSDGQNLISVLHTLYTSNMGFQEDVNAAMAAAFPERFAAIQFPPASDQRTEMRIHWKNGRRGGDPTADLSDGTLRFLFLLAILANPAPPPLVAIDEPELGLHPSMLPIVAEFAQDAATRTQVILATHSPEFLDAFGREPPTTTVVESVEGGTHLKTLSGEDLAYWLKRYTLGELFRSRELETVVAEQVEAGA